MRQEAALELQKLRRFIVGVVIAVIVVVILWTSNQSRNRDIKRSVCETRYQTTYCVYDSRFDEWVPG